MRIRARRIALRGVMGAGMDMVTITSGHEAFKHTCNLS
jgi:hypothetical protein